VYTIRARNTVRESVVENFVILDELPEGLSYVEGSLEVSDGGTAKYEDGKIVGSFGEVTDTEWRTVTFQAVIESGQVGNEIENVATISGDNIEDPGTPEHKITVDPKEPKLESEKAAELVEKAEGNTDVENAEVGDTLLYTIQARNTVEDSLVKNLIIRDELPEGLEYVPGTLTVDGEGVTDEEDDDSGHYVNGEIVGQFGDVRDTDWHTVAFQVIVGEGQASQDIENIATVDGDNISETDQPSEVVLIYPREPKIESEKTAVNLEENKAKYDVGDMVVYTIRARNTVRESVAENLIISDVLPDGISFVEGSLEVNNGGTGEYEDGVITASFGDVTDTEWRTVTFQATIEMDQSGNTIENVATVEADNVESPKTPTESITVEKDQTPPPKEPEDKQPEPKPEEKLQPDTPEVKGDESKQPEETLPNTATNNFNLFLTGLILMLAGAGIWYWRRKKLSVE
ncbi:isopeptide-forming domain-containing fimbrial protein, partial [Bacillus sp. JCM 19034]|uniref:isopeptide-forming domain-containing fimbrial protein n=1 Tax=Bacillus sp. JCM 19034 TaxID=1481928 RepID=UPI000AB882C8